MKGLKGVWSKAVWPGESSCFSNPWQQEMECQDQGISESEAHAPPLKSNPFLYTTAPCPFPSRTHLDWYKILWVRSVLPQSCSRIAVVTRSMGAASGYSLCFPFPCLSISTSPYQHHYVGLGTQVPVTRVKLCWRQQHMVRAGLTPAPLCSAELNLGDH